MEGIGDATARALVAAATAAPSMHNAQPWRFRLLGDRTTFQLYADLARVLPHADPDGRGLHLGCGAALFNLRVAAAEAGWRTRVLLLPDPDPRLLAEVALRRIAPGALTPEQAEPAALAELHPAIARRRSSRRPFRAEPVSGAIRAELAAAAEAEGCELHFPDAWHTAELLDLVRDAEGHADDDPGRTEDRSRWLRVGDDAGSAVDGVPEYAFGPQERDGRAVVRDFAARTPVPGRDRADFEKSPQLAILGTAEDRPRDWLRAGQGLERVLLLATLRGLSTSLSSAALERGELRWAARDPRSTMGAVQLVIRLGYGPDVPATPRRPVDEVLDIE